MITLVKAEHPYKPEIGDVLVFNLDAAKYLVHEEGPATDKIIPLQCVDPNPWLGLKILDIDPTPIISKYKCPYTGYEHYSIIPVALLINGDVKPYENMKRCRWGADYVLDWEWHKKMHPERLTLMPIQKLLIGSGYSDGNHFTDGHGIIYQRRVMLSNGDALWVSFWTWFNK